MLLDGNGITSKPGFGLAIRLSARRKFASNSRFPGHSEKKSRFRIDKLEERIAPAHVTVVVPQAAGGAVQPVNDNSPHSRLVSILTPCDRHGRVLE